MNQDVDPTDKVITKISHFITFLKICKQFRWISKQKKHKNYTEKHTHWPWLTHITDTITLCLKKTFHLYNSI